MIFNLRYHLILSLHLSSHPCPYISSPSNSHPSPIPISYFSSHPSSHPSSHLSSHTSSHKSYHTSSHSSSHSSSNLSSHRSSHPSSHRSSHPSSLQSDIPALLYFDQRMENQRTLWWRSWPWLSRTAPRSCLRGDDHEWHYTPENEISIKQCDHQISDIYTSELSDLTFRVRIVATYHSHVNKKVLKQAPHVLAGINLLHFNLRVNVAMIQKVDVSIFNLQVYCLL